MIEKTMILQNFIKNKHDIINFNDLKNCFDTFIWKKYTTITKVGLAIQYEGEITINIVENLNGKKNVVHAFKTNKNKSEYKYVFDLDNIDGIISIEVEKDISKKIYNGCIYSPLEPNNKNIKINYVCCTYRKEEYVKKNIIIYQQLIENKMLKNSSYLTVVDNGRTINTNKFQRNNLSILQNRNMGGAGGFTRGIYETVYGSLKAKHFTHITLMDDDIYLNQEMFIRNHALLSFVKKESLVGAPMNAVIDKNNEDSIVTGAFGHVFKGGPNPSDIAIGSNLRPCLSQAVLKMNRCPNITGWWWSCFPTSVVLQEGLPYPFFIKMDDVEYSLRLNNKKLDVIVPVTFWVEHDDFDSKYSAGMQYFRYRNRAILHSMRNGRNSRAQLTRFLIDTQINLLLHHEYERATLIQNAIYDFLRGPGYIINNSEIILKKQYGIVDKEKAKMINEEVLKKFPEYEYIEQNENKLRKIIRILTFNGVILPSRGGMLFDRKRPPKLKGVFLKSEVLYYNSAKKCGYIVKKSFLRTLYLLIRCLILITSIRVRYSKIAKVYKNTYEKFISKEFWEMYFTDENPINKKNKLKNPSTLKN